MHAQLSRVIKYFAVDVSLLFYSLYSIHCNRIVLNSTIVTYNYSHTFMISSDSVILRKRILTNFKNFPKFANFNEFKNL